MAVKFNELPPVGRRIQSIEVPSAVSARRHATIKGYDGTRVLLTIEGGWVSDYTDIVVEVEDLREALAALGDLVCT